MELPTFDRMVTDLLLLETSEGLDRVSQELRLLHESWTRAGADDHSLGWLAGLVLDLNWWSGRLLGGASFAHPEQGVPDDGARHVVS